MENQDQLILTQNDYQMLSSLVNSSDSEIAELLEEELNRATVVNDDKLPEDVVSMNSKVSFKDLDSEAVTTVTLVYPHQSSVEENKISILAPVGAALIGLRVGQIITWPLPHGKEKRLKVTSVHSQAVS